MMKDLFGNNLHEQHPPPRPDSDAKLERDEALRRIEQNAGRWFDQAMAFIISLPHGHIGTGEDIRFLIAERIGNPHHHNAYGSLISHAVKDRLIVETGRRPHMRGPKSHARRTPEYRRI